MIIFISMILWVVLMRLLFSGGMKYNALPSGGRVYKVGYTEALFTMGYIIFWVGVRSGMADTRAYIFGFETASENISDIFSLLSSNVKGQAWAAGIVFFKSIVSTDYHYWLMTLSMIMGGAVMVCYKRYSEAFFFSVLLFILNGNFTWMYNGMRQFLCVTTLMLAIPWLLEGRTARYLILVCLLGYIHVTALLMIPIYFIVRQRPWSRLVLLSIASTVLAILFVDSFTGAIEDTFAAASDSYKNVDVTMEDDDGVHPLRVVVALVPVILAWVNRKRIAEENNVLLNVGINMSLFAALLYSFGWITSGILMGRLPIYCEVYTPIVLPMLINRLHSPGYRRFLYAGCAAGYLAFFFVTMGNQYYISDLTGIVK